MIVVDTNLIVYLCIKSQHTEFAQQVLLKDPVWAVPLLWRSEFRNVLAGFLRRKMILISDAVAIMTDAELLVSGREYQVSSIDVLRLVNGSSCSAYDCEFVALAELLHLPLVTADRRIINEFPQIAQSLSKFLE